MYKALSFIGLVVVASGFAICCSANTNHDAEIEELCSELRTLNAHQYELANQIAEFGQPSIEPLFTVVREAGPAKCCCFTGSISEALGRLAVKYPEEFERIYRSLETEKDRWVLIHAVRQAPTVSCIDLLSSVFNNEKESQALRIQCMMCLLNDGLSIEILSQFEPGILLLLEEKPREVDLTLAISLAKFGKMKSATSLLIPLLDNEREYSRSQIDGELVPNRICDDALDALNYINDKSLPIEEWKQNESLTSG